MSSWPPDETLAPDDSAAPAWGRASAQGPAPAGSRAPEQERYAIRGEIARGGLGRILAAEDRALGRPVALKELLRDSPGHRARFLREIRLTARLQHPAIVPVYEAIHGAGGLQYAMKLVSGTTLAEAIAAAPSLEDRLALLPNVLAVADAVAYAHDQGIIHRDIKPQNILVGAYGETLLIDWGIAKELGAEAGEEDDVDEDPGAEGLTRAGAVVGTPAYMAPEQARGEPADRRADVYAVGATLYHLLSGRPAFTAAADRTVEALRTGERPPPIEALAPGIPPDLASIVRRAMEAAPADRYPSGRELREDLQRFSTGQLVAARRYTRADLLRRWLLRHRAAVTVATLALLLLIGSGAVAAMQVIGERDIARAAQATAEARSNALTLAHVGRDLESDPTEAAAWLLSYPLDGADQPSVFQLAQEVASRGVARVALSVPGVSCADLTFSGDNRGVFVIGDNSAYIDAQSGSTGSTFTMGKANVGVALGQGAALIASQLGAITRVDAAGQTPVAQLPASPSGIVVDSAGAVALVGDRTGGLSRIDLSTGEVRALLSAGARINGLALHGQGWSAASGDGSVWSGPLDGGPPRRRFQSARPILRLVALPGGDLIVGDDAGVVTRIGPDDRTRALARLPNAVRLLALGDQGRTLVAADGGNTLRAIDPDTGAAEAPPWADTLAIGAALPAGDGIVAAVLEDGTLRLWRPATGEVQIRRGRSKLAGPLAFSPDGTSLATCAVDESLRIWPVPSLQGRTWRGHNGRIFHPIFLPDGRIATDSDDMTVRVWPAPSAQAGSAGAESTVLRGHRDQVYGIEAVPGRLLSASNDGLAILWDLATGAGTALRGHDGRVRRAIFSADGQRVFTGGRDGTLRAWSLDGALLQTIEAHPGGVHWIALAGDGRVWSVGRDYTLRRWDPGTGRLEILAEGLRSGDSGVLRVFDLPGGGALTCADERTLIAVPPDGAPRSFTAPAPVTCPSIELSPDGRSAAVPTGRSLAVLDLPTGQWRSFSPLPDEIHSVAWSRDSRLLALSVLDGTVRLLRLADGAAAILTRREGGVLGAAFSPDGRQLAAGGIDHALWVGPVDEAALLPPDPAALHARLMSLRAD